jgi:hypothetical protein
MGYGEGEYSDGYEDRDSFEDIFRRADKHKDSLKRQIAKLRADPCMALPEVGDHVLIPAGPLGLGHEWIIHEGEVVEVASTAYERLVMRDDPNRSKDYITWVHQDLITDVLPKSKGGDGVEYNI